MMLEITERSRDDRNQSIVCYPKSRDNSKKHKKEDIVIGNRFTRNLHIRLAEISGLNGCFSFFSTLRF